MIWFSTHIPTAEHDDLNLSPYLKRYLWRSLRAFVQFSQFYSTYQSLPPSHRQKFVMTWEQHQSKQRRSERRFDG
ncbi:MAG: hypothetical protein WBA57_07065 [Elainellaceae cyanobacterium]